MSTQNKHAVAAALVVALVAGIPMSAAAILGTTMAYDELVARRTLELSTVVASSQARTAVAAAAIDAVELANVAMDTRDEVGALARAVAATAERVSETTVPFGSLSVFTEPGDTWESLADGWGLSATQLAALNPGVDPSALGARQVLEVYRFHPELPSSSRGNPSRGRILNAMPMPDGNGWIVRNRQRAWGTTGTISSLVRGLTHTAEVLPGGGSPMIADISRRRGGRMRPHRSHASGRDVDVTYFRTDTARTANFERTRRSTLDHARQWELFRYWIERDEITYIFIDNRLSRSLHDYAVRIGEDPALIEKAFGEPRGRGVLRYSPGHDDHFHVRFRCADDDDACRES